MKIFITSGLGGHFTLAEAIAEKFKDNELILITQKRIKHPLFRKNYTIFPIKTVEKSRMNILRFTGNFFKSFFIIIRERPQQIINTGTALGYFTCLFGKIFGAKVIGVEPNDRLVPSRMSIKKMEWFSDEIWLPQFELKKYYGKKAKVIGLNFPKRIYKTKPYDLGKLSLDKKKVTIMIVLSTLGTQDKKIIETILDVINLKKININLIMATGKTDPKEIINKIKNKKIKFYIVRYIKNFYAIAKASDIVITRAGLAPYELLMLKKKMIIIPMERSVDDHQKKTAQKFEKEKLGEVIYEKNLNENTLFNKIKKLLH